MTPNPIKNSANDSTTRGINNNSSSIAANVYSSSSCPRTLCDGVWRQHHCRPTAPAFRRHVSHAPAQLCLAMHKRIGIQIDIDFLVPGGRTSQTSSPEPPIHMYRERYVHMRVSTCICVYIYIYMYTQYIHRYIIYILISICTHIYIYIYTCTYSDKWICSWQSFVLVCICSGQLINAKPIWMAVVITAPMHEMLHS